MAAEFLSATILLILVIDPFGNVPLVAAALAATLVAADRLQRLVGERAMRAVERLMGLLLTAVAVEMLLTGIRDAAMQIAK